MRKILINQNLLILLIIVLFISVSNNYFLNSYTLIKNDYDKRMNFNYGNCEKEGYGFAKLILDKYEFKHNIYSINGNPSMYPSIGGLFYDINKIDSDDHLILINYQNDLSKKFKNYFILEQVQNCYLIKKIEND
jgi:hypothetical protein|tara:strand:- start:283 stop:684 length:402 start_codon:yes stop_codon:yes gene_type:complete